MTHLLFERPWPLAIALLVLGAAAWLTLRRLRRQKQAWAVAGTAAVLATAPMVLAALVTTERERLQGRTAKLVSAIATADTAALDGLLADDARVFFFQAPTGWDKAQVLSWIDTRLAGGVYAVERHEIAGVQAALGPTPGIARTRASVRVTPAADRVRRGFICMLTWREDPDGWRVVRIELRPARPDLPDRPPFFTFNPATGGYEGSQGGAGQALA